MAYTPSIVFGGNALNRIIDRSDEAALKALYHTKNARVLPFCNLNPAIRDNRLDLCETDRFPIAEGNDPGALFLGLNADQPLFSIAVEEGSCPLTFMDARSTATLLPPDEAGIVAQARTLHDWHARNGFCARCGNRSHAAAGGVTRVCPACGAQHFPKLEPAVIMLVIDGDRCLVGRQSVWLPGRYSTLAGFVEAGETLEDAVRRETLEEAGIMVGRVAYAFSQPWPFPASLMLGFFAEAESTTIMRDDEELEDALWVDRDEAARMVEKGEEFALSGVPADRTVPHLPGPISLGHQLVKAWLAGVPASVFRS